MPTMAAAASTGGGMKKWLQAQWWPIIVVTGATVASMGVWMKRRYRNDPDLHSRDRRDSADLPNAAGAPGDVEGYGRVSASKSGLMEGDRAFQGIFPAKRMTEAMSGVLPAKQPDHPSIEKQPEAIKTTTPRSRPAQ